MNAALAQSRAGAEKLRQLHGEGEMTYLELPAVFGFGAPQAEHRSSGVAGPKKNDVAPGITEREFQTDDIDVELLRCFGIGHRQMSLVKMHSALG